MSVNKQIQKFLAGFFATIIICQSNQIYAAVEQSHSAVRMKTAVSHPVLLAGQTQTTTIKVSLFGDDIIKHPQYQRPAVNLAIVLDKSGSMQGQKMHQARQAAIMAIQRLGARDVVSIISYDDDVDVVWPAAHVSNKNAIIRAIQGIRADGSTALYAGVERGAAELMKYLEQQAVNRVILLSDGLANVGPSSPQELAELGRQVAQQGITVTTIGLGLGYNEDLMTELAGYSDGNHVFAENAADLAHIFDRELQSTFDVIAKGAEIHIHCHPHIRPINVIGREAHISGQTVSLDIGQIYRGQEKFVLLEVEVDAGANDQLQALANVNASYQDLDSGKRVQLKSEPEVRFSASSKLVEDKQNRELMVTRAEQMAVEKKREAIELRDAGQVEEAEGIMGSISQFLKNQASRLDSDALYEQAEANDESASEMSQNWNRARKKLKEQDYQQTRQAY